MRPLKAHVHNGRLVLDEPTDLPEGSEVEIVLVEDDFEPEERARLVQAVEDGARDFERGEYVDGRTDWSLVGRASGSRAGLFVDELEAAFRLLCSERGAGVRWPTPRRWCSTSPATCSTTRGEPRCTRRLTRASS